MPVTATGVYGQVWGSLSATMPTVLNATRQDPTKGIMLHNTMSKMLTYCCRAWVQTVIATPVGNTYAGVAAGTAVATPTSIMFPTAPNAGAQLIATLGWVGPSAPVIANALTRDIAQATALQALYVSGPAPGGGVGTGVILPNNQAPLISTAGLFLTALNTQFMSEGLFSVQDLKVALTPQISIVLGALAGVYATMYSSIIVKGAIAYAGAAAPAPLSIPVVPGKIV